MSRFLVIPICIAQQFHLPGVTEVTLLKLDQVGEGHQVASTVLHTGLEYWAGQGDS